MSYDVLDIMECCGLNTVEPLWFTVRAATLVQRAQRGRVLLQVPGMDSHTGRRGYVPRAGGLKQLPYRSHPGGQLMNWGAWMAREMDLPFDVILRDTCLPQCAVEQISYGDTWTRGEWKPLMPAGAMYFCVTSYDDWWEGCTYPVKTRPWDDFRYKNRKARRRRGYTLYTTDLRLKQTPETRGQALRYSRDHYHLVKKWSK